MPFETPGEESKAEISEKIRILEERIAQKKVEIAALEKAADEEMERKFASGELEKPEMPKQPGWEDAPDIRKALRNMRDTGEVELWYRYAPELFKNELFTETIMQGVWSKVRESEKFDSGFKESMRVKKRQYIMYSGDLTMGFDPNATKKIHAQQGAQLDNLRKLANKRLTDLGPKEYFEEFENEWTDKSGTKHESIGAQYRKLIADYNRTLPTQSNDAITEPTMSGRERRELRYKAGETMYSQVSQNLANDEFTMMPGMLRELYVVMRNLEVNQIEHYRSRDLDVKIPMVEFLISQFRDEILQDKEMSPQNLKIFSWFVNQAGQSFINFEGIGEEYKDWYEIIKSLVGRRGDQRVQPSKYVKLASDPRPVMEHLNELRLRLGKPGLPPLTVDTQPFGRIGVGN